MALPRPCKKCGKRFLPVMQKGQRYCPKLCLKCKQDIKCVNFIKLVCSKHNMSFNKLKELW